MNITKQAEANRRNALKSTGPKSKEGKAKSRMNALKHGLTGKQVVIPGEDPEEFEMLLSQLMQEHDPQSMLETSLVELIAGAIWRLKRIPQFEPAIILAYRTFNDQADVVSMLKLTELLTSRPLKVVYQKLTEMREKGELSKEECVVLDSYVKYGEAASEYDTPVARLGRALVLQGNALEQLGKLSRYERELTSNLESHMGLLAKAQQERRGLIESRCDEAM